MEFKIQLKNYIKLDKDGYFNVPLFSLVYDTNGFNIIILGFGLLFNCKLEPGNIIDINNKLVCPECYSNNYMKKEDYYTCNNCDSEFVSLLNKF